MKTLRQTLRPILGVVMIITFSGIPLALLYPEYFYKLDAKMLIWLCTASYIYLQWDYHN